MKDIKQEITLLAEKYRNTLKGKIDSRVSEMLRDNNDHYLIYRVLGVAKEEGCQIDIYQNKGRFLYKYAGSFLEAAATLCFEYAFTTTQKKVKIPNKIGSRPKTFEIDVLVDNIAYEIKWRDATTDGDHITKEHTRARNMKDSGYKPVRIMFYYPNRGQAIRIQDTIKAVYTGLGGLYYFGDEAWNFIKKETGVDLKSILEEIAKENESK